MTRRDNALGRLAGAVIAAWLLIHSAAAAQDLACNPEKISFRTAAGERVFRVEIADTPATRGRGLMFRRSMPADAGMLFVFDPPRPVGFWMRNTLLPLDMIFIDDTGDVKLVAERYDTQSDAATMPPWPVRAVLEINAGLSEKLGIAPGVQAVNPVFAKAPAGAHCRR